MIIVSGPWILASRQFVHVSLYVNNSPLIQLLPIISFVAPPLSKLHVVVTVSRMRIYRRNWSGNIQRCVQGIPWIHPS